MNSEEFLWVERYRPRKISDCILPESIKANFQQFVDKNEIPNMILAGGPGMGKTTVARAMCEQLGLDYILINGSVESNIDTLRTKIIGYASAVSLTGGRKVVIIDEADYLNPNSTQPAFRGVIEEFASNCGFIFTCNYANRIIQPLHSRCPPVEFTIKKEEKPKLAIQILKRLEEILQIEKIQSDRKVLVELITRHFPDIRRMLGELQRYSASGKIDVGIFTSVSSAKIAEAISYLKQKDFRSLLKWVGENVDNDSTQIMREVYDKLYDILKPEDIPAAVVLLADYGYKAAFAADKEINLMAFFSDAMIQLEMKE